MHRGALYIHRLSSGQWLPSPAIDTSLPSWLSETKNPEFLTWIVLPPPYHQPLFITSSKTRFSHFLPAGILELTSRNLGSLLPYLEVFSGLLESWYLLSFCSRILQCCIWYLLIGSKHHNKVGKGGIKKKCCYDNNLFCWITYRAASWAVNTRDPYNLLNKHF